MAAALAVDTARRPVYVVHLEAGPRRHVRRPPATLAVVPAAESVTGIPDPAHNVAAVPDYTRDCTDTGLDDSAACTGAALAAINHAHALEGVQPMVLPAGFTALTMPEQLFVAIDLERVDRGLPPFVGLTTDLDTNAQRGADDANDPPDPGRAYDLDDSEWAGGSSNALDAVYGWMYDDGFDSGNLDCTHRGAAGCWGHRKGILDDFGSGADLVMGAAVDDSGDTHAATRAGPPWRSRSPWPARRCTRTCSPGRRWWRRYRPERSDAASAASLRAGPRAFSDPSPLAPAGAHLGCANPARTSRGGRR